jgi:hypothetical protein
MQFYKLLGASDLIGNPVSFVDKLGTGLYELIDEPRKGVLTGDPAEMAAGLGRGVTSLVTGVTSAGFGSVGKITGSASQ